MRNSLDLPDELLRRVSVAAAKRGTSVRDLIVEAVRRLLAAESGPVPRRMTEAPIKLPPGKFIPARGLSELEETVRPSDFE